MTCIAGYKDFNGDIYMGGDSIGVGSVTYVTVADPKVFRKKNMVFGFTSSFRMGQILQYDFEVPSHHVEMKTNEYLVSVFIPRLISKFEETKWAKVDNNQIEGGTFLLGYNKKLFEVHEDFQVLEILDNYNSCGCGEDFAKGAFWMMDGNKKIKPQERVITALECAAAHSLVKAPFHVIKLPHDAGLN